MMMVVVMMMMMHQVHSDVQLLRGHSPSDGDDSMRCPFPSP
jgi:hypothetical protein